MSHLCIIAGGFAWAQRRAQHFMKMFAATLAGVLQRSFSSNFWQMPFRSAQIVLATEGFLVKLRITTHRVPIPAICLCVM